MSSTKSIIWQAAARLEHGHRREGGQGTDLGHRVGGGCGHAEVGVNALCLKAMEILIEESNV